MTSLQLRFLADHLGQTRVDIAVIKASTSLIKYKGFLQIL